MDFIEAFCIVCFKFLDSCMHLKIRYILCVLGIGLIYLYEVFLVILLFKYFCIDILKRAQIAQSVGQTSDF